MSRAEESRVNDFSTSGSVWRVDLKWVFAIPFTLALILVLLAAVMSTASGSSKARGTYGEMLQPGLADPEFRADLVLVSPEMLAFLESPEFPALVYDDPEAFQSGVEALPDDPEGGTGSTKGLLSVVSRLAAVTGGTAHSFYRGMLLVFVVISLVLGALVVLFSRRLGRLVSPAFCLALASLPLFLLSLVLRAGVDRLVQSNQGEAGEKLAVDSLQPFIDNISGPAVSLTGFLFFLALVLLVVAGIWKLLLLRSS